MGGTIRGSRFADTIDGTNLDDTIYGDWGDDHLYGHGGVDHLYGDQGRDHLYGGVGDDWLFGGAEDDELWGEADDDHLDGGAGADTMRGGSGNDTYLVDNAGDVYVDGDGDVVIEARNEGWDTVFASIDYILPDNVEELHLVGAATIGVGNSLDNRIYGTSHDDILAGGGAGDLEDGDDWLDGGGGGDWMMGGGGDDTYVVDNAGDIVDEGLFLGDDTIISSITFILPDHVENLILSAGAGGIDGLGNDRDNKMYGNESDNALAGGGGGDTLDGGGGADIMWGERGNDKYYVDNVHDTVAEFYLEGNDSVYSSVSYALGANVENVFLLESGGPISATGNGLYNVLSGNNFSNTLAGGAGIDDLHGNGGNDILRGDSDPDFLTGDAGADTLTGGTGGDSFVFERASDTYMYVPGIGTMYDHITDFSHAQGDQIILSAIGTEAVPLSFIGSQAFHHVPGEVRFAGHFVQGDTTGDGIADFKIQVDVATLERGDFLL